MHSRKNLTELTHIPYTYTVAHYVIPLKMSCLIWSFLLIIFITRKCTSVCQFNEMSKFAYTTIKTIELYLITLIEQSLYTTIHYWNNPTTYANELWNGKIAVHIIDSGKITNGLNCKTSLFLLNFMALHNKYNGYFMG